MKLQRRKRKQIRLSEAMATLQLCRTSIRNLIFVERRLNFKQRKPGTTSPIYLFQAEVDELAREWGLL